jgi:anti-sigma B factor antagonist
MAKIEAQSRPSEDDASLRAQEPILRSAVVNDRDGLTVLLEGELDLSTGPGLYSELDRLVALAPHALVLDLSRLEFIDSTGVSVLNTTREHALARGVRFAIRSPSRAVERVLEVTALWELFDTTPHRFENESFEW